MMNKKIAIIFAYMKNNLGDDIFVQQLCERYPSTQFYISELDYPNETLAHLPNLHFSKEMKIYGKEIFAPNLSPRMKKFFEKFDASVIIGGSIFMQKGNNWWGQVQRNKNCLALSKKLFIIGANFGPFRDSNFLSEYNKIFAQTADVCFRDTDSLAYFPDSKTIRWAPDVIFTCNAVQQDTKQQVLISLIDCTYIGRPQYEKLKKCADSYENKLIEICSEFARKGFTICLTPFCKFEGDTAVADRVMMKCLQNGVTDIRICEYNGDISSVLNEISCSQYILATRFHAMILGWLFDKPTYPIIYDQKQKSVIRDLDFTGQRCNIENFGQEDTNEILKALTEYMSFDCSHYIKEAQNQFAALDEFLNNK